MYLYDIELSMQQVTVRVMGDGDGVNCLWFVAFCSAFTRSPSLLAISLYPIRFVLARRSPNHEK